MARKNKETPVDLFNAKCPKCHCNLKRFGGKGQINFKCTNPKCSRFYSEEKLRELLER